MRSFNPEQYNDWFKQSLVADWRTLQVLLPDVQTKCEVLYALLNYITETYSEEN